MKIIQHKFVEFIPNEPEEGILYITVIYRTAVHLCVCGCGKKVVTPFSPTDWELTFNGKTVSLSPSIGNWNFECKSHYFITNSKIHFVRRWKDWEIEEVKKQDVEANEKYYKKQRKKK